MKVFISWSGDKSKAVAQALHEWIPYVINEVKPFMSADSIKSGERWGAVIATELDKTNFGLICTTAQNQEMPWLNFEAGALAKQIGDSRVVPIAIDLEPSEIRQPLGQFNAEHLTYAGILRLIKAMNSVTNSPRSEDQIETAVEVFWPKLEAALASADAENEATPPAVVRTEREILLEVLDTVRGLTRAVPTKVFSGVRPVFGTTFRDYAEMQPPYPRFMHGKYAEISRNFDRWLQDRSQPVAFDADADEWVAEQMAKDAERDEWIAEQMAKDAERAEDAAEQAIEEQERAEDAAERTIEERERAERDAEDAAERDEDTGR